MSNTVAMILVAAALQQDPRIREGYVLPQEARRGERQVAAPAARPAARVYVIPLEWSDLLHPNALEVAHFEEMFFSRGTYTQQNRARQQTFGSVADWLAQDSYDRVQLTGRVHPWISSDLKWADIRKGVDPAAIARLIDTLLLQAAVTDREARLDRATQVVLIYMGSRGELEPTHPLWPRTTAVKFQDRDVEVILVDSGLGSREAQTLPALAGVGTCVEAVAHSWGLVDHAGLRARGEGVWCLMGTVTHVPQPDLPPVVANDHRPPHMCAACRARLGWLTPVTVDVRVRQKVALRPIERYPDALCVPITADGSDYYLLENRQRVSFDRSLPAAGLLIWRVRGGEQELIAAHGMPFRNASWKFPALVPFPTLRTSSFTPGTHPSSRRGVAGERPVSISGITVASDGVVYLEIGDPAAVTAEVEFEGERYRTVPTPPPVGLGSVAVHVVLAEFVDVAHAADARSMGDLLFEFGPRVVVRDAKGEVGRLTGGLADYVFQASGGAASVRGMVADGWVRLPKARASYAQLAADRREKEFFGPLLEGTDLKEADALVVVVAGAPQGFLSGHVGSVTSAGRAIPYALVPEDQASRDVGLPSAAVLRAAGLEGRLDRFWCTAGQTQIARDRYVPGPTLPCSWCRMRLGWLQPFDIAAPGRFALAPLAVTNHAARIPIREGEYYLLENRSRWDFDRGLPREGLVIWHVTPPDARCTSCSEGGILDVWLVHDPPQGGAQAAQRYAPFQSLPKKGLSLRLSDGKTDVCGIKMDARSNVYFEVAASER